MDPIEGSSAWTHRPASCHPDGGQEEPAEKADEGTVPVDRAPRWIDWRIGGCGWAGERLETRKASWGKVSWPGRPPGAVGAVDARRR